jgi:hypothetical protein
VPPPPLVEAGDLLTAWREFIPRWAVASCFDDSTKESLDMNFSKINAVNAVAALLFGCAALLSSDASADIGKITGRSISINNVRYFRSGADESALGCVGYKRGGLGVRAGSFEKAECMNITVAVDTGTEVSIDAKSASEFAATARHPKLGGGEAFIKAAREGKIKLRKFSIEPRALEKAFKPVLGDLKHIDKAGGKLSTVLAVWVLVDGEESTSFSGGGSADANIKGVDLTIKGSGSKSATIKFSPGTIMAYEQGTIEWTNGKKEEIKKIDRDAVGAD